VNYLKWHKLEIYTGGLWNMAWKVLDNPKIYGAGLLSSIVVYEVQNFLIPLMLPQF
jgi:hypothetical protein